jgi:hypothetical protein
MAMHSIADAENPGGLFETPVSIGGRRPERLRLNWWLVQRGIDPVLHDQWGIYTAWIGFHN